MVGEAPDAHKLKHTHIRTHTAQNALLHAKGRLHQFVATCQGQTAPVRCKPGPPDNGYLPYLTLPPCPTPQNTHTHHHHIPPTFASSSRPVLSETDTRARPFEPPAAAQHTNGTQAHERIACWCCVALQGSTLIRHAHRCHRLSPTQGAAQQFCVLQPPVIPSM
jgi:hypothetical protein